MKEEKRGPLHADGGAAGIDLQALPHLRSCSHSHKKDCLFTFCSHRKEGMPCVSVRFQSTTAILRQCVHEADKLDHIGSHNPTSCSALCNNLGLNTFHYAEGGGMHTLTLFNTNNKLKRKSSPMAGVSN